MHEGRGFQAPALWPLAGLITRFYRKKEVTLRVSEKTSPLGTSVNAAASQSYAGGGGAHRGYRGGGSFPKVYA
jgi:hypothetical protein